MGKRRLLVGVSVIGTLAVMVAGSSAGGAATAAGLLGRGNGDVAFAYGGSLLAVNPSDPGVLRGIASCPQGVGCTIDEPTWSPNGRKLAFVQGAFAVNHPSHMLLYVIANGEGPRRLASCGSCSRGWASQPLAWSPNGKWIAFSRDGFRTGKETLWIVAAAGGKPHRLTHCRSRCDDANPSWSPNGHRLVYERFTRGSTRLYTIRRNGSHQTKISPGEDPQWSPDGLRIAFEDSRGIEVANADGTGVHLLFAQTGGAGPGVPSWSPDGRKLVFFNTPGGPSAYTAEVWTMNADGTDQHRLYHSGCCVGDWAAPIWSPDGTMIAFSADSAGGTYIVNADGTGLKQLTPKNASLTMSWQQLPRR